MSPTLIKFLNEMFIRLYQRFFNLQKGKDFPPSDGSCYLDDGFLDL